MTVFNRIILLLTSFSRVLLRTSGTIFQAFVKFGFQVFFVLLFKKTDPGLTCVNCSISFEFSQFVTKTARNTKIQKYVCLFCNSVKAKC